MRSAPDWSIQVAWWLSGIFATGAAWYFLSIKDFAFAADSVVLAILFAGVAVYLHRKKDALAAALVPNELKSDLPGDYVRRSTDSEAHVRIARHLPEMKAVVHRSSSEGWGSSVTLDMREASYDMIDFLQFAWLRLAEFYPRKHFDATDARDYVESYTRTRFAFHWAKHEPGGPGSGGTIVGVLTGGDVIRDLESLIEDTMRSLFFDNQLLDLEDWLQRWQAAGVG
ncbi:hypothetical protein [Rhodoferax sp.]|uniref:hypothetical protein n=1 Tax=Rhodoferax sp. TaxID=50421 RepID=UPI00261A40B6|nr:hypothetical protein [Rhodoferax sp.]MDD3938046.1 hypothetical protein [Rhodoferax sp.]